MVVALVGGMKTFVAGAHHERGDLEHGAAVGARRRCERAIAAIDSSRWSMMAPLSTSTSPLSSTSAGIGRGILGPHLGAIAEAGKRLLLVGHAVAWSVIATRRVYGERLTPISSISASSPLLGCRQITRCVREYAM